MPIDHLYVLFGKISIQVFYLLIINFLKNIELCELFIYLAIIFLSYILFTDIFFHLVCCPLILLMVSFTAQKLFVILLLFPLSEETDPKKVMLRLILGSTLPLFYSRSFMASRLTFKSLIHFIFVCGLRKCSSFTLLHVAL